jgi:hypothetical protein
MTLQDPGHRPIDVASLGHIERDGLGAGATGGDRVGDGGRMVASGRRHDSCSLRREPGRNGPSDAA